MSRLSEEQRRNDGKRKHPDRGEGERKGRDASERNERQYNQANKRKEKNLPQDWSVDEVGEHSNSFTRAGGDKAIATEEINLLVLT
ncbi:hypothetical protein [Rhizobium esperanzae]|uniref:Uncharacterized protein n=1 Tax=Rhizobium esperanzae TaxID=1967781 RepID=A0A7W6W544_9HYPH|nr:hypothetical protein [Rhizobium esperanzae]MBB4235991.1 hypothetical protein [Rhizobium esperanzae]